MEIDPRISQFLEEAQEDICEKYSLLDYLSEFDQDFTVLDEFARGGMKKIVKVHDNRTDRILAMAKPLDSTDKNSVERFLAEAFLTARIEHPNIITVHHIGLDDDTVPFFTMELKDGDDLWDILEKLKAGDKDYCERYSESDLLEIFIKVCDAIAYAHSQGVLHLDIKPANVQVASFGEVKVCDWGLGVFYQNSAGSGSHHIDVDLLNFNHFSDTYNGTPGYMAPEQLNRSIEITPRADIYALGALLHAILTLEISYGGSTQTLIGNTKLGTLHRLHHNIPRSLSAVIEKAMALDPEDRYQDVIELRNEVRRYLSSFPTRAEGASLMRKCAFFYRRNKTFCRTVFSSFAILMSVFIVYQVKLLQKEEDLRQTQQEAKTYLQQVEEEKEISTTVTRSYTDEILFINNMLSGIAIYSPKVDLILYEELINKLNAAIAANPNERKLVLEKALILFICQRYNECYETMKNMPQNYGKYYGKIRDLAKKYGAFKKDSEILTLKEISTLIREFADGSNKPIQYKGLLIKMVYFERNRRTEKRNDPPGIRDLLHVLNPEWKGPLRYEWYSRTLSVDLTGLEIASHLILGNQNRSFFEWFDFSNLVILGGGDKINYFNKMSFYTIDMRRVDDALDAHTIANFPVLREVIVLPGQVDEKFKEILREKNVRVVEKELGVDL